MTQGRSPRTCVQGPLCSPDFQNLLGGGGGAGAGGAGKRVCGQGTEGPRGKEGRKGAGPKGARHVVGDRWGQPGKCRGDARRAGQGPRLSTGGGPTKRGGCRRPRTPLAAPPPPCQGRRTPSSPSDPGPRALNCRQRTAQGPRAPAAPPWAAQSPGRLPGTRRPRVRYSLAVGGRGPVVEGRHLGLVRGPGSVVPVGGHELRERERGQGPGQSGRGAGPWLAGTPESPRPRDTPWDEGTGPNTPGSEFLKLEVTLTFTWRVRSKSALEGSDREDSF